MYNPTVLHSDLHFKQLFICAQGHVGRDVQCSIGFNGNNWKGPTFLLIKKEENNFWYSHATKYYAAVKVNEPNVYPLT